MTFEKKSSRGSTARTIQCVLWILHKAFSKVHIHSLGCVSINLEVLALHGRAEQIGGKILQSKMNSDNILNLPDGQTTGNILFTNVLK